MTKDEIIKQAKELLGRLYRYGEEGLTIDANIAREIEDMISLLESAKAELPPITGITPDEMPEHWKKAEPPKELRYLGDEKHDAANCPVCNELSDKQAEPPTGEFTKAYRACLEQDREKMGYVMYKTGMDTCDLLDAQQQEIAEQAKMYECALEEIHRLTAENKALTERIKRLEAEQEVEHE